MKCLSKTNYINVSLTGNILPFHFI